MTITLDDPQIEVLQETLASALKQLRVEVAHADNRQFKQLLHDREKIVEAVLAKLASADPAYASGA